MTENSNTRKYLNTKLSIYLLQFQKEREKNSQTLNKTASNTLIVDSISETDAVQCDRSHISDNHSEREKP